MEKILVSTTRQQRRGRRPLLNKDRINNLVEDYNTGFTQTELSHKYSVSLSTVQKYLRERRINE